MKLSGRANRPHLTPRHPRIEKRVTLSTLQDILRPPVQPRGYTLFLVPFPLRLLVNSEASPSRYTTHVLSTPALLQRRGEQPADFASLCTTPGSGNSAVNRLGTGERQGMIKHRPARDDVGWRLQSSRLPSNDAEHQLQRQESMARTGSGYLSP